MLAFMATAAWAEAIDLTALTAYVRPGFRLEWVFQTPLPSEKEWTVIPGARGNRPLIMRELGLEGSPEKTLFPLGRGKPMRYCIMIPFTPDEELLASRSGVGLFLPYIGMNWQIYLNGSLIRDETYTSGSGEMRLERAVRGALVEMDTRTLRRGKNLLAVMIEGDPLDDRTGFFLGSGYSIDAYDKLERLKSETAKLGLIGIYFFFAIYHFVLYALRPKAKSYLFYGLATILLAAYFFSRTYLSAEIILDTKIIRTIEITSLLLMAPMFLAFFDTMLGRPVSKFAKVYGAVFTVAAVLQSFFWSEAFVRLWMYTVPVAVAYILIMDLALPILRAGKAYFRECRGSFWKPLWLTATTDAGKLLLSVLVIGLTMAIDVSGLNANRSVLYSEYGFLFLAFGTAAVLAGQFNVVYRDIETLRVSLEDRVEARTRELESVLAEQDGLSVRLSETSAGLQAASEAAAKDMRIATQVQQGFFPNVAPRTDQWEAAFAFLPASGISGDFYDFYMRGSRLDGLVVGDVSGHGIASGLITVLARSFFHRNFYELKQRSLGAVLEAINDELIPELSSVENFITAVLLRLDDDGTVEYASAAHTEILYKSVDKLRVVPLKPRSVADYKGPPLGREGIESPYKSVRFALKPGDAILIYTDGIDEAKNVDGEPFGMEGVREAFTTAPAGDAAGMLDFVMGEWRFHVSGTKIADDATAIILKKL